MFSTHLSQIALKGADNLVVDGLFQHLEVENGVAMMRCFGSPAHGIVVAMHRLPVSTASRAPDIVVMQAIETIVDYGVSAILVAPYRQSTTEISYGVSQYRVAKRQTIFEA